MKPGRISCSSPGGDLDQIGLNPVKLRWLSILLACIFCFSSLLENRANAFDDALIAEFRTKAPAAWEGYAAKGFIFRGEMSTTITDSDDRPPMRRKTIFKEQVRHRLIEEVPLNDDSKTIISAYGFNSDYYFIVQKKATSPNWLLTNLLIRKAKEEPMVEDYRNSVEIGVHQILFHVGPARLPKLFKESTFKVLGAQPINLGSDPCVKVEFDNTHTLATPSATPIQSGWFVVDPSNSWCVRDYQVKTKHSNANSVHSIEKLEIRPSRFPGFPLPVEIIKTSKSISTESDSAGTQSIRRTAMTYQIDDSPTLSLAEFRLPAYNLPEPEGFDQSYLWYHAMGITALFATSVILFLVYRRKAAHN